MARAGMTCPPVPPPAMTMRIRSRFTTVAQRHAENLRTPAGPFVSLDNEGAPSLSLRFLERQGGVSLTSVSFLHLRKEAKRFPFSCRPLRFDFYNSLRSGEVVSIAAPFPVFGIGHQPSNNRIAMYVAQLLDPFVISPDVEVVVAGKPEGFTLGELTQFVGADLLEHLERHGERAPVRFAHQKDERARA